MPQGLETCAVFGIIVRAMANLNVLSRQPEKIVLGKGGAKNFGNLIGLLIFGVVVCVGMSAFLEEGVISNPVLLVIGIIVAVAIFSSVVGALRSTRVVIDSEQRLASREDKLLLFPIRRQTMALNVIRDVQVSATRFKSGAVPLTLPFWQVDLRGVDGSTLLVNERGTHVEMRVLADEVGAILKRPVRDAAVQPSGAPAPAPTRSAPDASIRKTRARQAQQQAAAGVPILATSARQAAEQTAANAAIVETTAQLQAQAAAASAPILQTTAMQAYDQTIATAPIAAATARQTQAQVNANMPVFDMGMRMAFSQMSAFTSDVAIQAQMNSASAAADAPFVETSARLVQQQSQAAMTMEYGLMPLAGMAQMPAAISFPPVLTLPALAPVALDAVALTVASTMLPEARWDEQATTADTADSIENERAGDRDDPTVQFRAARQLYAQGNYADAQAAYERALDGDPGSASIHNDLGVLFLQQRKLDDAERAFRKTIALDPFFAPGRYNLGVTLLRQGKRRAAVEQFRLGANNAPAQKQDFQDALRGNVHAPMLSG
jgi:tetratricopeptide (TPR) repeat protein